MAIGFDVGGTLGVVKPDKGFSKSNEPVVFRSEFGDGYELRIANGINNIKQSFTVNFATRPKDEIDDIVAFFEGKQGVTSFNYTFADSNAGSSEETVKVVVDNFTQTWKYDDFYDLKAIFRRLYEA